MKRIVETDEASGLESLLGEKVLLMCANYFYAGKLTGVNADCVVLEEASIVYETGIWSDAVYKDAQRLPGKEWYVRIDGVESYGLGK